MAHARKHLLLFFLVLVLTACSSVTINIPATGTAGTGPGSTGTSSQHQFGVQTKTSGCMARGALPDPACTPGALLSSGTKDAICQSGYSKGVRNVTVSEKDQVYTEYGIASHTAGAYEVDHLVSLELGGSNEIANLWPELASPMPGFHQKDGVENYLHAQVCSGAVDLKKAQIEIATNWLPVYSECKAAGKCS